MIIGKQELLQKRVRWPALAPAGPLLRTSIAGLVGLVLGSYVLAVSGLSTRWMVLLVIAAIGPFVVMFLGNLRRLLLAIIILDIPFQWDVHLGYRHDIGRLGALGGLGISATTAALVLLYGLWLAELLAKHKPQHRQALRISLPLLLYVGFALLSLVVAPDPLLAVFEIFMLVQTLLLYIYVASTVRTRQDVLFIVTILLVGVTLECLIIITSPYITIPFIVANIDAYDRPSGTLPHANTAASYLSLLLAPALGLLLTQIGGWRKQIATLTFGLGMVALTMTLSRGGWMAFAISVTLVAMVAWYRRWLTRGAPLFLGAVLVLLAALLHDPIATRLFGDDGGSAAVRVPLMRLAFAIIEDYPALGAGANNFALVMQQYHIPELEWYWRSVVHNKFLLVWAETGIGGLLAFVAFLIATIWQGWQSSRCKDRVLSILSLAFTAAILGHLSHMLVDLFRHRPLVQLLWLIAALIAAMHAIVRDESEQANGVRSSYR